MLRITDTIAIADSELNERFVRGSGPGGQTQRSGQTARKHEDLRAFLRERKALLPFRG